MVDSNFFILLFKTLVFLYPSPTTFLSFRLPLILLSVTLSMLSYVRLHWILWTHIREQKVSKNWKLHKCIIQRLKSKFLGKRETLRVGKSINVKINMNHFPLMAWCGFYIILQFVHLLITVNERIIYLFLK